MINPQLAFTVSLKQALERTGTFVVHPFTTPDAALDYLQDHPQDVALIDLAFGSISADDLVRKLRAIQPDIAIVASPAQPETVQNVLRLQGSIDMPYSARDVIPLLNEALIRREELSEPVAPDEASEEHTQPTEVLSSVDVDEPPPEEDTPHRIREFSSFDGGLDFDFAGTPLVEVDPESDAPESTDDTPSRSTKVKNFDDLVRSMRGGEEERRPLHERTQSLIDFNLPRTREIRPNEGDHPPTEPGESTGLFRQLSDEEPPLPSLEENGTIGDLMSGVVDTGFRDVLAILRGEQINTDAEAPANLTDDELQEVLASFYGDAGDDLPALSEARAEPAGDHVDPFRMFEEKTDEPEVPEERTPARVILETTLDESTPPESFSLDDLIQSIASQLPEHQPNIQPLPSWIAETDQLTSEPDFLPEEMPPGGSQSFEFTGDLYDQTTRPSGGKKVEVGNIETEAFPAFPIETPPELPEMMPDSLPSPFDMEDDAEEVAPSFMFDFDSIVEPVTPDDVDLFPVPDDLSFDAPELATGWEDEPAASEVVTGEEPSPFDTALFDTRFNEMAAFDLSEVDVFRDMPAVGAPTADDPKIAQLALGLTQASLESTAEATILSRAGRIIAYAGQLSREDVEELSQAIENDWDTETEQTRIRFVRVSSSGDDYMLYSRHTEDDLTLSMVFAAQTRLGDIRRQSKRLMEALQAVPDMPADGVLPGIVVPQPGQDAKPAEPKTGAVEAPMLVTYAAVWTLRDAGDRLNVETAEAMNAGLRTQLQERGWIVTTVQAEDGYVYVLAQVSDETPAPDIIRDMKRRSAEIAKALEPSVEVERLWADGYLMLTPGRELSADEIQQYIAFERM